MDEGRYLHKGGSLTAEMRTEDLFLNLWLGFFRFAPHKLLYFIKMCYQQISDCGMVLEEQPGKVSEAFRLFLQGEGYGK